MIGLIILGVTLILVFAFWIKEPTKCPECGSELREQGFDGWKIGCTKCSWNNHNNRSR